MRTAEVHRDDPAPGYVPRVPAQCVQSGDEVVHDAIRDAAVPEEGEPRASAVAVLPGAASGETRWFYMGGVGCIRWIAWGEGK